MLGFLASVASDTRIRGRSLMTLRAVSRAVVTPCLPFTSVPDQPSCGTFCPRPAVVGQATAVDVLRAYSMPSQPRAISWHRVREPRP